MSENRNENALLNDIIIRFDKMDARFDSMGARLDGIDARFDGIDARLDGIDARLDKLETRTANLESTVGVIHEQQAVTNAKIDMLQHSVYWGFAIIVFVVAFVSIPRGQKKEDTSEKFSLSDMLSILRLAHEEKKEG